MERFDAPDAAATVRVGERLATLLAPGDAVLLEGPLGAGKTTFARGVLRSAGWVEAVRSPTFPLLIPYPTRPPIVHADLYRVASDEGLGLEEFADDHVLLIEWPDRLRELAPGNRTWRVRFESHDDGRRIEIEGPVG